MPVEQVTGKPGERLLPAVSTLQDDKSGTDKKGRAAGSPVIYLAPGSSPGRGQVPLAAGCGCWLGWERASPPPRAHEALVFLPAITADDLCDQSRGPARVLISSRGKKKKKGTLLEFYQGARIKLTAAFCFVFKDLPFGAPPGTRGGHHSEQRAAAPPARENKTISLSPCTFQARPFLRSRHLRAPPAPGSSEQRFMALGCSHPGRSFAFPSAEPPSPHHGRPRVWLRAGTEGPVWQGNGV